MHVSWHDQLCVNGCISNNLSVLSGVPQVSVLGLLLFICYINDTATAISSDSEICMFADAVLSKNGLCSSDGKPSRGLPHEY